MDFLIIGGDAAGMSAASRAKRTDPDLNVTVLEKTMDVSYSACGMPYNIAEPKRDIEDLVVRRAEVFRKKQGINLLTGHFAEKVDILGKTVTGTNAEDKKFSVKYDKLLIATGASPVIPPVTGANLPGVMPLKSLEHGRAIKYHLQQTGAKKVVIIGMGYIALEMCEALIQRGIGVDMVKPRPTLLPWMAEDLRQAVEEELKSKGVNIYAGHNINAIKKTDSGLEVVCDDLTLKGEMVLMAYGVKPNSEIAGEAGLELSVGGSIAVDKNMRTSHENIFAAGDCADAFHIVTGKKTWIPLALLANRGGWAVADNVCGKNTALAGIVGTAVFKVFDLQVARCGLTVKEAEKHGFDPAFVSIKTRSKAHAHPGNTTIRVHMVGDRKTKRLLGAQMVGAEGVAHRINAVSVALHSKMSVEEFSQTDLAYAPPFGPVWDPLLTAANQLIKRL